MRLLSSARIVVTLAVLSGCASSTGGASANPTVALAPRGEALEQALADARLRFNTAARARDVAGMAALFAPDAMVITPQRDTIRGRDAVAARIAELAPAGGSVVQLLPRRVEACADGAFEAGGEWAVRPVDATARELASGDYALRWGYDAPSGMLVELLILHGPSAGDAARAQREVRCVAPHVTAFAGRRFEISISPPHAGMWQSRAGESVADDMRGQGFATHALLTADGESIQSGLDQTEAEGSGAFAVRWRIRPPLVLEFFAPFSPLESRIQGYDEGRSADVTVLHSARIAGVLASYEWRRLRFGAGPVFVRSTWHEREQTRVAVRSSEGEFSGFVDGPYLDDMKYTTNGVALAVEAGYTYPVSRHVFADFRLHYRGLAERTTRGTTSLQPIDVDLGGFTAALGFGYAF